MSCLVNGLRVSELENDAGGGHRPDERPEVLVVLLEVSIDADDETADAGEAAAAQLPGGQLGEEPLHQVQPRTLGGNKVHVKTRRPGQPRLDIRVLMHGVGVHDQMHVQILADLGVDLFQKRQILLVPVVRLAVGQHLAGGHVQRREERGRARPCAVVRVPSRDPLTQRQQLVGCAPGSASGSSRRHSGRRRCADSRTVAGTQHDPRRTT